MELVRLHRKRLNLKTIVINDNYLLAPWADVLYACDPKWWKWHIEEGDKHYKGDDTKQLLEEFKGKKVTQDVKAAKEYNLNYIKSSPNVGLSTDPTVIHQGHNSGYQAINLAYNMGAERILLIGYDMKFADNGQAHWFGDHPDKVRSGYKAWLTLYGTLAAHAKELNLEIINCTISTALNCFPKMSLESALSLEQDQA